MDLASDLGRSTHKLAAANRSKTEKEETFTVMLSETSTTIHLALTSFQVASDTRDVMVVDERNARYEAVIKSHTNVDGFASRSSQTKNNQLKNQNEMAAPNAFKDSGSQAISYEIKDEIAQLHAVEAETDVATSLGVGTETKVDDLQGLNASVKKYVLDTVGVALVTPGCLLDTTRAIKPPAPGESQAAKPKGDKFKNRSMASMATGTGGNRQGSQISLGNNSEIPSDDENVGGAAGAKKGAVSQASSDNNSGNDAAGLQPSGSRANISQSNAGDSTMDSEDGSNMYHGNNNSTQYEAFTEEDSLQLVRDAETKRILSQPILLKRLQMIERAIQQNANYRNQLDYRDLPDIAPLTLLSPERAKQHDAGDAGPGGLGKSALNIKKFSDRSRSVQHGMGQSETSQYFSDTASVMSADETSSVATGADKKNAKLDTQFLLSDAAKVKKLFTYANKELIEGRAVTAMAWNAVSSDLLAVGYGRLSDIQKTSTEGDEAANGKSKDRPSSESAPSRAGTAKDSTAAAPTSSSGGSNNNNGAGNSGSDIPTDDALQGLVLFWSLRNPDYPEKILRTSHSVTALDFSRQHPMILAVGLSNGDVNIYDVKREGASWTVPVESSAGMPDSHLDPVWNLKWIVRGVERLETLGKCSSRPRRDDCSETWDANE